MILRIRPTFNALALVGLGALAALAFGPETLAASDTSDEVERAATPSAIVKWDLTSQSMTAVEAAQLAEKMEVILEQMEQRFIATGRIAPSGEVHVETTASGLKKTKATVDLMNFAVVRVGEDGELTHSCVDDPDAAGETMVTPVETSAAKREEK